MTKTYLNPYVSETYTPDWSITLNNAQKAQQGGRQDDWPAQHDHALLFVPQLTPQFLRDNNITPMRISPGTVGSTNFTVLGIGSTGGAQRWWQMRSFQQRLSAR